MVGIGYSSQLIKWVTGNPSNHLERWSYIDFIQHDHVACRSPLITIVYMCNRVTQLRLLFLDLANFSSCLVVANK